MELPVTLSPPVKAYPAYGFPLSILYARDDRFDPWLLGQFITVVGERGGYSLLKAEYDWMYTAEREHPVGAVYPLCRPIYPFPGSDPPRGTAGFSAPHFLHESRVYPPL